MEEPDCPLCGAPPRDLEHLKGGWRFCNSCAMCHQLNDEGEVVATAPTGKTPLRRGFTNTPRGESKWSTG